MGALAFLDYGTGSSAIVALFALVMAAEDEHGDDGQTGTIAEKGELVMIQEEPLKHLDAEELANKLIKENDSRIDDKWGPAGCIPIIREGPEQQWLFFGWAAC